MAKHGSTYGFRAAIKHFSKKFGKDLKQNTISEWIKVYINKMGQKRTSMDTSAGHVTLRAKKGCREQVTCDSSLSFVCIIFAALPSLLCQGGKPGTGKLYTDVCLCCSAHTSGCVVDGLGATAAF